MLLFTFSLSAQNSQLPNSFSGTATVNGTNYTFSTVSGSTLTANGNTYTYNSATKLYTNGGNTAWGFHHSSNGKWIVTKFRWNNTTGKWVKDGSAAWVTCTVPIG